MAGPELPRSQDDKLHYLISDLRFDLYIHRMEADTILSIVVSSCTSLLEKKDGQLLRQGGVSTAYESFCLRLLISVKMSDLLFSMLGQTYRRSS